MQSRMRNQADKPVPPITPSSCGRHIGKRILLIDAVIIAKLRVQSDSFVNYMEILDMHWMHLESIYLAEESDLKSELDLPLNQSRSECTTQPKSEEESIAARPRMPLSTGWMPSPASALRSSEGLSAAPFPPHDGRTTP